MSLFFEVIANNPQFSFFQHIREQCLYYVEINKGRELQGERLAYPTSPNYPEESYYLELFATLAESWSQKRPVLFARTDIHDAFALGGFLNSAKPRSLHETYGERSNDPILQIEMSLDEFLIMHSWKSTIDESRNAYLIWHELSRGEQQVLLLSIEGCSNRVIANRLDISERTVEVRRKSISTHFSKPTMYLVIKQLLESIGASELVLKEDAR